MTLSARKIVSESESTASVNLIHLLLLDAEFAAV